MVLCTHLPPLSPSSAPAGPPRATTHHTKNRTAPCWTWKWCPNGRWAATTGSSFWVREYGSALELRFLRRRYIINPPSRPSALLCYTLAIHIDWPLCVCVITAVNKTQPPSVRNSASAHTRLYCITYAICMRLRRRHIKCDTLARPSLYYVACAPPRATGCPL